MGIRLEKAYFISTDLKYSLPSLLRLPATKLQVRQTVLYLVSNTICRKATWNSSLTFVGASGYDPVGCSWYWKVPVILSLKFRTKEEAAGLFWDRKWATDLYIVKWASNRCKTTVHGDPKIEWMCRSTFSLTSVLDEGAAWGNVVVKGLGIDSQWCRWGFFRCYRRNHVPWGRMSF
jgi:hypothetical protein